MTKTILQSRITRKELHSSFMDDTDYYVSRRQTECIQHQFSLLVSEEIAEGRDFNPKCGIGKFGVRRMQRIYFDIIDMDASIKYKIKLAGCVDCPDYNMKGTKVYGYCLDTNIKNTKSCHRQPGLLERKRSWVVYFTDTFYLRVRWFKRMALKNKTAYVFKTGDRIKNLLPGKNESKLKFKAD